MDHDVHIVEQNPLAVREALLVPGIHPQLFSSLGDRVGNGLHLHIRIGRTDDKEVGHVGERAKIHDRYGVSFLGEGKTGYLFRKGFCCQLFSFLTSHREDLQSPRR